MYLFTFNFIDFFRILRTTPTITLVQVDTTSEEQNKTKEEANWLIQPHNYRLV